MGSFFSILISAIILAGILLFGTPVIQLWSLPPAEPAPEVLAPEAVPAKTEPQISTPPPLRRETEVFEKYLLTPEGIVAFTNEARSDDGLPPLTQNPELDKIAELRLRDMFAKQYFAHYSPEGRGAADEANAVGYEYLAIGENLALGSFEGDSGVVDAWLQSPGHRANILSDGYTEIGAAAGKGSFEGKTVWLAVQIFGLPRSVCPEPETTLKNQLESLQNEAAAKQSAIESLRAELESWRPQGREEVREYNRKVDDYNLLVREYNRLIQLMKSLAEQYNGQVEAFNSCLSSWQADHH